MPTGSRLGAMQPRTHEQAWVPAQWASVRPSLTAECLLHVGWSVLGSTGACREAGEPGRRCWVGESLAPCPCFVH